MDQHSSDRIDAARLQCGEKFLAKSRLLRSAYHKETKCMRHTSARDRLAVERRRAYDGFVSAATHIPGAFEGFVGLGIPELLRRGLYHREYEGLTLRETLGLGLPQPGWWK
jgi:hypothetical protein